MSHHTCLILYFFSIETGFLHAGHAGLELLTSGDLPTSASQTAGSTGTSHHTQPLEYFLKLDALLLCRESIGGDVFLSVNKII